MISAFGIDHGGISKAFPQPTKSSGAPSSGRVAATYLGAPVHGLVAGRKGRKLAAAGTELGMGSGGLVAGKLAGAGIGGLVGGARGASIGASLGSAAGGTSGVIGAAHVANRQGFYKPEQPKKNRLS